MEDKLQIRIDNDRAYDSLANQYDEVMDGTPYYSNIRATEERLLTRVLRDSCIRKVVDIGCGTGFASIIAAEKGKEVVGVDPCPRMLDVARNKAHKLGEHVEFVCASAEALPAAVQNADLVVAFGSVLNHCDDWELFFDEIRKSVGPRGQLVLTVDNLLGLDSFTWAAFRLMTGRLDGVGDLYRRASAWWNAQAHLNHWPLETSVNVVSVRLRYERPRRVIGLLEKYGFRVRRIEGSNLAASISPETVLSSAHLRTPKRKVGRLGRILAWLDRKVFSRCWLLAGTYVVWAQTGETALKLPSKRITRS